MTDFPIYIWHEFPRELLAQWPEDLATRVVRVGQYNWPHKGMLLFDAASAENLHKAMHVYPTVGENYSDTVLICYLKESELASRCLFDTCMAGFVTGFVTHGQWDLLEKILCPLQTTDFVGLALRYGPPEKYDRSVPAYRLFTRLPAQNSDHFDKCIVCSKLFGHAVKALIALTSAVGVEKKLTDIIDMLSEQLSGAEESDGDPLQDMMLLPPRQRENQAFPGIGFQLPPRKRVLPS